MSISLMLLGALSANAANHEVNLELGRLGTHGEDFAVLDQYGTMPSLGLRGGYALTDRVTLVADWQRSRIGGTLEAYNYDDEGDDYESEYAELGLALGVNQMGLGAKYDLEVFPWLHPYGTAQFLGALGVLRLDDETDDDDNENQLTRTGFAPGGVAALGIDLIPLRADRAVRPATHLEMGYAYLAPMKLGDTGDLDFRGFYLRWGVGARF